MRPRKPFREPRFRHLDEEPWREVLAQDHGGRRVVAREKWLDFTPRLLAFVGRWDPGMIIARHGHMSINTIFVVEGSILCDDVECPAGANITLDVGTPYGPNIAGPDGATVYEVMGGDPTPWYADPEEFAALKRTRGVRQLPNPPLPGAGEGRASYDEAGMLRGEILARPPGPMKRPRFRRADGEDWREVLAQEQGGRRVVARRKWLEHTPRVAAFVERWDADLIVAAYGRLCIGTVFVLEGSMTCGDVVCAKGMHVTLEIGVPFGPCVAGLEGVVLYAVMLGDPAVWDADPDGFEALRRSHGVLPLPDPAQDPPAWMREARVV